MHSHSTEHSCTGTRSRSVLSSFFLIRIHTEVTFLIIRIHTPPWPQQPDRLFPRATAVEDEGVSQGMGASESRPQRAVPTAAPQPQARVAAVSAHGGPHSPYWQRYIVEVIPGLWLGSREAACNRELLGQIGVHACVNCTPQAHLHPEHFSYLHVPVGDTPEADLLSQFDRIHAWVQKHLVGNRVVLVYCQAGVSRSCTVTLALLLHLRSWTLLEAWSHVKGLRPCVRPNPGFLEQLCQYEVQTKGHASSQIDRRRHGFVRPSAAPTERIPSHRTI